MSDVDGGRGSAGGGREAAGACNMCHLVETDDEGRRTVRRPEVFRTERWLTVLNGPDQRYPGRCIVVARRHVPTVPDLDEVEWRQLKGVMRRVETAARDAFGAALSNWGCLMNHAFQASPARPHVHWHFRPRYAAPVEIDGLRFEDDAFGRHYEREYRALDETALLAIRDRLRDASGE